MASQDAWPQELRLNPDKNQLTITFDSGDHYVLSAEYLRVESPSAEVQGHGVNQKMLVPGKQHVKITGLSPVGNYAVRIEFDDGHNTGLYSWRWLDVLGREQAERWSSYESALSEAGLSRAP